MSDDGTCVRQFSGIPTTVFLTSCYLDLVYLLTGVEIVVVGQSDDYSGSPKTTRNLVKPKMMTAVVKWNFVFVMLFCLNLGHMTTRYI